MGARALETEIMPGDTFSNLQFQEGGNPWVDNWTFQRIQSQTIMSDNSEVFICPLVGEGIVRIFIYLFKKYF